MLRRRFLVLTAAVLASFATSGAAPPARAWPWFLLIRGDGLEKPVVVGRRLDDSRGDVIRLYASLQSDVDPHNDFAKRRHYEVAEFWGPDWFPDTAGRPIRSLRFEDAGTVAKIYVGTATQAPVWVGRWQGRDGVARAIGDEGRKILEGAGIRLR